MRMLIAVLLVSCTSFAAAETRTQTAGAPAAAAAAVPAAIPAAPPAACAGNPNVLGVARTVEIDTAGGPGFGFEHFKAYDFLRDREVVLTFDDGPWPHNTPEVLAALAAQCTKATFFPIGKHAIWHPEILKQVAAQGHTVGSHTWSHANLAKKTVEEAKDEIERGISAVHAALGTPDASFFRFPALKHPPEMLKYLAERNIGIFSTDIDSFDFKWRKRGKLVPHVMSKLASRGKGIILMHDFQRATADDLAALLAELKANGYRVVHMKPKEPVKTLANYDAAIIKELSGTLIGARPTSSVVRTIEGN
jgi:peptidoglycan/xylan/chitin deacetylase (PgdA/CDA1 family)